MSVRIATPFMYTRAVDMMQLKQNEISNTELQLASGMRILNPADDPSASVQILDLKESQAKIAQYQRNADAATARLSQEETALDGISNLLQRTRELMVQGNNDTFNQEDRAIIAQEVRQQMENFLQLANTRDANGEYLFGGFQTNQPPLSHDGIGGFSYQGDQGQRSLQIGDSREVAIGDPGSMFMDIPAEAGGTTNIGEILYNAAVTLESGSGSDNALSDIDSAMSRIFNTQASIGARMNAIDDQKTGNAVFNEAVQEVRSSLEDLDYAEAISRFNQQLAALQASQQSFMKIQDLSLFNYIR